MEPSLALKHMEKPVFKGVYHIAFQDKTYHSGLMGVYDYGDEEIYTLPNTPKFQALTEKIGEPFFSKKGVNTTSHYFKAPSRDALLVAIRLQNCKVKDYMTFKNNPS